MGHLIYVIGPDNNPIELQADVNGNLKTVVSALPGTVLNTPSAAITASATSLNLSVGAFRELAVDVNISAITGTTPTYQLLIDRLGADGIWYNIYTGASITAVGVISLNLGANLSTNVSFGNTIRIREVVGGTTPSVTRSVSILGK